MRTTTAQAWAAAVAVMSMRGPLTKAEAAPAREPERPKYYFPRHVKRQYPNLTAIAETSTTFAQALSELASSSPASSSSDENTYSPLPILPLFNPPTHELTSSSSTSTVHNSTTSSHHRTPSDRGHAVYPTAPKSDTISSSTSTSSDGDGVLGGVVGSAGLLRPESVSPTAPRTQYEPSPSTSEPAELLPTLLYASTGLLPPLIVQPTPESRSSESSSSRKLYSFNPQRPAGTGTASGLYGEAAPTPGVSASSESSTAGPILVGLTTYFESTTSLSPAAPSTPTDRRPSAPAQEVSPTGTGSTSSSADFNPLEGIVDPLTSVTLGIIPPESTYGTGTGVYPTGSPAPTATGTEDVSSMVSSIASQVSSAASSALSGASATGNSTGGGLALIPAVSSALSEIASSLSTELSGIVATATDAGIVSSLAYEFSGILSSAASSLAEQTTGLPYVTATLTGTGISTGAYTLSTSTGESGIYVIPIPLPTGSSSSTQTSYSDSSLTATDNSTTVATTLSSSSGTGPATYPASIPLSTGTSLTLTAYPTGSSTLRETSSEVSSPTVTSPVTTTDSSTSKAPESLVPTGSDTATVMTYPSSISFAPSTTESLTSATGTGMPLDSSTTTAPTGMSTAIPRLIQPPGGLPAAQTNMTLIQVGFNYGLNYQFVVNTENSAGQIFLYLPRGISYGLGISEDKVIMNALMPFDTTKSLSYITTLAQAWVPSDLVNQLQLDLHTLQAPVYHNPEEAVATLMSMINPTIPLLPGPAMDDGSSTSSYNPAETAPGGGGGGGAPIGGDSGSSQKVKGTSVGIGVGAVCGAAVYAAAMIYVARRYRKRRRSHRRASSVPTAGEMSQRSPGALSGGMGGYFMSGGNGLRGSGSAYGSNSGRSSGRIGVGRGSRNSAGSSNGRSVREQGISAPVMAENSLGWN